MDVTNSDFETFEQQFLELVGEFNSISSSESRVREALRGESARAEAAEAGRDAAERAAAAASSGAAAAAAGATQAAEALAKANDEITALKMQLELAGRQRSLLEDRCTEMSSQIDNLEQNLNQLKPLQSTQALLQRQYTDLQEKIRDATEEARREASRLEIELRRVEKSTGGGAEIRERARLAAAAHSRDKRLATNELQHTTKELLKANAEIARLGSLVAELQYRLSEAGRFNQNSNKSVVDCDMNTLAETKAALEAERAGNARLERTLAAALADNATLASYLNKSDNTTSENQLIDSPVTDPNVSTSNCPLDAFLAE